MLVGPPFVIQPKECRIVVRRKLGRSEFQIKLVYEERDLPSDLLSRFGIRI